MKKEDYLKLSKERLAELLAERDAMPQSPVRIEPIVIGGTGTIPCYEPGGICLNPQRDCINCPKLYYGGGGFGTMSVQTTTSNTNT